MLGVCGQRGPGGGRGRNVRGERGRERGERERGRERNVVQV